jgi:hypothetical protein
MEQNQPQHCLDAESWLYSQWKYTVSKHHRNFASPRL